MTDSYDYVIVGGGTAGCIVAARLSEDPGNRVLLLEAGADYRTAETPDEVLDVKTVPMRGHAAGFDPSLDWGLIARTREGAGISVPQGRVIGGGSAINGAISLRGATADYEEWVGFGNPDWSWEKCLPTFVAMENDAEPGDFHGHDGPIPLTRATEEELAPIQAAFIESAVAIGTPYVRDLNAPDVHGVGPVPMTRIGDRRVSTAESYLEAARGRENLTVRGDALVERVLFEGTQVVGVRLTDGTEFAAREVIVSAGAILSPAILQRSGIGPSAVLASLGITSVVDLPVGENLGDHFNVPLMAQPKPGVWQPVNTDSKRRCVSRPRRSRARSMDSSRHSPTSTPRRPATAHADWRAKAARMWSTWAGSAACSTSRDLSERYASRPLTRQFCPMCARTISIVRSTVMPSGRSSVSGGRCSPPRRCPTCSSRRSA